MPADTAGDSNRYGKDRDEFNLSPVFFARAYCPFCGREQEWFAQEAWVCDDPSPSVRVWADVELADAE